jgi:hypothetical protein
MGVQPIVFTSRFTDVARMSLTSTSTRWGQLLVSQVSESTPVIFSSPV